MAPRVLKQYCDHKASQNTNLTLTNSMKLLKTISLVTLITSLLSTHSMAADISSLEVKTKVVNGVMKSWTLECPDGGTIDLMTADISEEGLEKLMSELSRIESENGVAIKSKTIVRDHVIESDTIESTTTLTEDQARRLCQIVAENPAPPQPKNHRPKMFCVHDDGKISKSTITLPDGQVLDLAELDDQLLEDVLNLIKKFEEQNGVEVISTTQTNGGRIESDRIITLTWLTPNQIQELHLLLALHQLSIVPHLGILPTEGWLRLQLGRRPMQIPLEGEMVIQRNLQLPLPDPNQPTLIPIAIVQLDLVGAPSPNLPFHLGLDPLFQSRGFITAPSPNAPASGQLNAHLQLQLPNGFNLQHQPPIPLQFQLDSPFEWIQSPFTAFNQAGTVTFENDNLALKAKLRLIVKEAPRVILAPINITR